MRGMMTPLHIAVAAAFTLAACKTSDPLYCDAETPCTDPERPFCDFEGAYPASEGIGRTCIPEPDFALSLGADSAGLRVGGQLELEVAVDRLAGFPGDIDVTATGLPPGASADPLTIPDGATTGTLVLRGGDASPGATATLTVTAAAADFDRHADLDLLILGPPGSLDPTFGVFGFAAEPADVTDDAMFVAHDRAGRLIVCGEAAAGVAALVAFAASREPDPAFGQAGVAQVDLAAASGSSASWVTFAHQPELGTLAVVGTDDGDTALARVAASGALDSSFGDGGIAVEQIASGIPLKAASVAVGRDNEVIVVLTRTAGESFYVVRFLSDGTRDRSFASGRLDIDFGSNHVITGSQVLVDGAVLITGVAQDAGGSRGPFILRTTAQGTLDSGFGDQGLVLFASDASPQTTLALDDGLLVAGSISTDGAVWRLTSSGQLDASFGNGGLVRITRPGSGTGLGTLLQDGNAVLGVGWGDITVVRLDPATGKLDEAFGDMGVVTQDVPNVYALHAVRQDAHRFVVLADNDSYPFVLARFFD